MEGSDRAGWGTASIPPRTVLASPSVHPIQPAIICGKLQRTHTHVSTSTLQPWETGDGTLINGLGVKHNRRDRLLNSPLHTHACISAYQQSELSRGL